MDIPSLIIAVIAVAAFMRTGGVREQKHPVPALSATSHSVRARTADALDRLKPLVRGQARPKAGEPSAPPTRADTRRRSGAVRCCFSSGSRSARWSS